MEDRVAVPDEQVLDDQRETWNAVSSAWMRWHRTFERGGAPVTTRLLQLGGVRPGQSVLDVGTGVGEPAISAARLVGPTGRVVGVDVAEEMISSARRRAVGLTNVVFVERAVETLELPPNSFDVVLSRWCLMFLTDVGAVLRKLHRLLVPGGVLAAAVWSAPANAPVVGLPFQVLNRHLHLAQPPAGQPGAYGMSDPRTCVDELVKAGFADIAVVAENAPFWIESSADYTRFAWDILPLPAKQMLDAWCDRAQRSTIWADVTRAATEYRAADGRIQLPSTALCLRAVKPSATASDL